MAILETQSRGGSGIVAVLGVFAARRIQSKAVLFGGGAVGLIGLFIAAGVGGRQSGGAAEARSTRAPWASRKAWIAAWRMAVGRPLTGVGLNCYIPNFYYYSDWWEGLFCESSFISLSVAPFTQSMVLGSRSVSPFSFEVMVLTAISSKVKLIRTLLFALFILCILIRKGVC